MAACFRLVSPLKIPEEEKGCLMVMADPSDLGHGKNRKALDKSSVDLLVAVHLTGGPWLVPFRPLFLLLLVFLDFKQ